VKIQPQWVVTPGKQTNIFVIKIGLRYTEGEKFVEAAAEHGTVVFHTKKWGAKESGECSIMHAFIFCTPRQILVNTIVFMT
jgi:hypothetical protein